MAHLRGYAVGDGHHRRQYRGMDGHESLAPQDHAQEVHNRSAPCVCPSGGSCNILPHQSMTNRRTFIGKYGQKRMIPQWLCSLAVSSEIVSSLSVKQSLEHTAQSLEHKEDHDDSNNIVHTHFLFCGLCRFTMSNPCILASRMV